MRRSLPALLAIAVALAVVAFFALRSLGGGPDEAPESISPASESPEDAAADLVGDEDPIAAPLQASAPEGGSRTAGGTDPAGVADEEAAPRTLRGRVQEPRGCRSQLDVVEVFALSERCDQAALARLLDADAREAMPREERPDYMDENDDTDDDEDLAILARGPVADDGSFALEVPGDADRVHLLAAGSSVHTWSSITARTDDLDLGSDPSAPAIALPLACAAAIEGTVRLPADDGAGPPVAGVPVRISASLEDFMGIPTGARRMTRHAVTNDAGRFAFAALTTDTTYLLDVVPADRAAVRLQIEKPAPGSTQDLEIELPPGAQVSGTVRDEEGAPIAGSAVVAQLHGQWFGFDNRMVRETLTAADGTYTLPHVPEGEVVVRARLDGHMDSQDQRLELAPGEDRRGVDFTLEAGHSVEGLLTWPDGAPAAGVTVRASFDRGYLMDMRAISARRGLGSEGETDAEGRFAIRGLSEGPFTVRARALPPDANPDGGTDGGTDGSSDTSAVEGTTAPVVVESEPWRARKDGVKPDVGELALVLEAPIGLGGLVRSTDGSLIQRFRVNVSLPGDGPGAAIGGETHSRRCDDESGAFLVTGLRAGSWRLFVQAEGFAASEPQVAELPVVDGSDPLVVVLEPACTISGRVLSPMGSAVTDAEVRIDTGQAAWFAALEGGPGNPRTQVDGEGTFLLEGLRAGSIAIIADARDFARSDPLTLELEPGEVVEDVVLALLEGGSLTGEVLDDAGEPDTGVSVRLTNMETFEIEQTRTDQRGEFLVEHMSPGRWQVTTLPAGMTEALGEGGGGLGEWISEIENAFVEIVDGETSHVVLGEPPANPVRLTGTVLQGGEPYEGAILSFIGEGTADMAAATIASVGDDGRFETTLDEPGEYLVYVQQISGSMGQQNTIEFHERIPEGDEHHLDLVVPMGRISGRVVGPDGDPAANARVSLRESGGVSSASLWGGHYLEVATDEEGRYDVSGLRPGSYSLAVGGMRLGGMFGADTNHARNVRHGLELGEDEWLKDVDFRLESPGKLAIRVVDGLGRPVSGASVFVRDDAGELVDRLSLMSTSGSGDCTYGGLEPGTYTVNARKEGDTTDESAQVRVRSGETTEVALTLDLGGYVLVSIRDAENLPLPGDISVRDTEGREWAGMLTFADIADLIGEGGFSFNERRIGPLPAGRYDVSATVDGRTERRRVTVKSGAERRAILRLK